jgi:hypothetical protein
VVLALRGRGVVRPLHLGVLAVTQASKAKEAACAAFAFCSYPHEGGFKNG